jgi:pyrroloquinoline quinone biosynthesis protein D
MTPSARPMLARRARLRFDRLSGQHVLLAPERGFRLNESAAAILSLCDGQRSLRQIAEQLAPPEQEPRVLADVLAMLEQLESRGLLCESEP